MKIIITEDQFSKILSDQNYEGEISRPVSFTKEDREMLQRIYDVVVRGGAGGGYGGVRRRAIPALGTLPDSKPY
jgi:hypothetical protein|tara:strand:+ start:1985 stop:2206 length:222 start_codon:yes stop_codon:yes gene_type:complete